MRHWLWRTGVFCAAGMLPGYWLYQAWIFALGPDPGKVLVDRFGLGTLVLLLITLGMTPLRRLTGWSGWMAVRRQLGLWCFTYAVLHMVMYLLFILGLDWGQLGQELAKRPYIIVGSIAWSGLLAMALTSNRYSQRRLGKRWKTLHLSVHAVLLLGLLHMLWIVRADLREWFVYGCLAGLLWLVRIPAIARRLAYLWPTKRSD